MHLSFWLWCLIISWPVGGYFIARLVNSTGLGHEIWCLIANGILFCGVELEFYWHKPIRTTKGHLMFLLGVVSGWSLVILLALTCLVSWSLIGSYQIIKILIKAARRIKFAVYPTVA